MTKTKTASSPLPANVRVMIALVASPTLMVVGMLLYTLVVDGWRAVSISMIVFSILSGLAYYTAISGHPPRFSLKKPKQNGA